MEFKINLINHSSQKVILPCLKFEIGVNSRFSGDEIDAHLLVLIIKLILKGDVLTQAEPILRNDPIGRGYNSYQVTMNLNRDTIRAIEEVRGDDLELYLTFDLLYSYSTKTDPSKLSFQSHSEFYTHKLSQKDWSQILQKMGYQESWIIEIPRPNIEGLPKVFEHLEKSQTCLQTHAYEECMTNLRTAWNTFKDIFQLRWEEISKQIDCGSVVEEKHDTKSKRIKDIKDKIEYFSQVGTHRESYRVFPEDAFLNYYQTVAMISYLSKMLLKSDLQKQEL
jgi:hypothetical protein